MYLVTDGQTPEKMQPGAAGTDGGMVRSAIGALVNFAGGAWSNSRMPAKKRMRVIETLALGAKKQLVLVSCDGEHFLVGTGPDQVQTIVRLGQDAKAGEAAMPASVGERV